MKWFLMIAPLPPSCQFSSIASLMRQRPDLISPLLKDYWQSIGKSQHYFWSSVLGIIIPCQHWDEVHWSRKYEKQAVGDMILWYQRRPPGEVDSPCNELTPAQPLASDMRTSASCHQPPVWPRSQEQSLNSFLKHMRWVKSSETPVCFPMQFPQSPVPTPTRGLVPSEAPSEWA